MTDPLPYTRNCFVCGIDNPGGLRLRFHARGDEIHSVFVPGEHHAGYKGLIHGGVVAAALDEAMFWAASHATRCFHVSAELSVRYRQKVLVAERYELTARLAKSARGLCRTEAELRDAAGKVCASASGKYLPLPADDISRVVEDFVLDDATVPIQHYLSE